MFLPSIEVAENSTLNHGVIIIKGTELNIRPLISKQEVIIVSNVCSIILHEIIEAE